jgi:hypothetical protein
VLVSIGRSVAFQAGAERLHGTYDVLEVAGAAGQAVDPRNDQHIALAQEIENRPELGAAFRGGAACLLLPDDIAAGGLESFNLNSQVLIGGADPGIPDGGHFRLPCLVCLKTMGSWCLIMSSVFVAWLRARRAAVFAKPGRRP